MENLNLDNQTLIFIAAGVLLLFLVIIVLIVRRKKKKSKSPEHSADLDKHIFEKIEGKKYQGIEPSDEELEGAPKLVLEKFVDGFKSISFRFRVQGKRIKLDEVDPYDNKWIKIHNYNELVGQTRSNDEILHIYLDRKNKKRPSVREVATISVVYRAEEGRQWIQQIKYSSDKGAKLAGLKALS